MAFALAALALAAGSSAADATPPVHRAVKARAMLDVSSGRLVDNPVVLIIGDRITAVGTGLAVPDGYAVIDLGGATILPGLIDAHTHLTTTYRYLLYGGSMQDAVTAFQRAKVTLDAGITSVRDLWAKDFTDVALRDAIERGEVSGPRMQVATLAIGATGGHNEDDQGLAPTIRIGGESGIADGVDAVRRLVRYEVKYGADVIKIMATEGGSEGNNVEVETQFSPDEMRAIVEEAHRLGKRVAAHAHGTDGIKTAVRAGVDSIEHGTLLDDEAIRMMKERGTWLVPTGAIWDMAEDRPKADAPAWSREREEILRRGSHESFRKAVAAGLKIAMGSDASVLPHGRNPEEVVWMAKNGMTPLQAIRAATLGGAELMGWSDRVGAIAPGKYADIIAVRGNPLDDVTEVERVAWVMKGGKVEESALEIAAVKAFLDAKKRGDNSAAQAMLAPDARSWFDEKKGPGDPYGLDGRWSGWDAFFRTASTYSDWTQGRDSVTANGEEMNDFYRLIERSPSRFRATWWLDSSGRVAGFLYEPGGMVVPGDRFTDFQAWARREKPAELESLMPGGRIDPTGDRPRHFRDALEEWRRAAGLPAIDLKDGGAAK